MGYRRSPMCVTRIAPPRLLPIRIDTESRGQIYRRFVVCRRGIEFFALCEKKETTADSPTKRKLRDEMYTQRFQTQADRYLKELRAGAMIEYKQ